MPAWSEGKYLWIQNKITYTSGDTAYTQPYCDTGWEAAVVVDGKLTQTKTELLSTMSQNYTTKGELQTVDGKFADYSTTAQMNSAINQKADEINLGVSQEYATQTTVQQVDGKFASYSTTTQMNTAIQLTANEINQTVSQNYTTKGETGNIDTRLQSAESKLTPSGLTLSISEAITANNAITTTKFVMDKDGLLIKNGGLTIKNNAGVTVLSADSAGNLTFKGNLEMQGAQVMRVNNASGTIVGNITFRTISGEDWSPGALKLHGYDFVSLEAGDTGTTKAIGQIRAGDEIVGMFGHEIINGVKKYFFGFGQYGADLAYEETVESSGTITTGVTYKGTKLEEVSGKFVLLATTSSTNYMSTYITPSSYKAFLLVAGTSGTFRTLASLIIPYDAFIGANSHDNRCEVAYPVEINTYMSYCYYTGGYAYIKCKNSTYGAARLYGIT